jgi:hypothetical protein
MAPATYDKGIKSPDAEVEPLSGMTGVMPSLMRLSTASTACLEMAECPLIHELHLTAIIAFDHAGGME